MLVLYQILDFILMVAQWMIVVQAVLSLLIAFNVINTSNDFVRSLLVTLERLTEPLYRPIRRILPQVNGIDLASFVVLLIIILLRRILPTILLSGYYAPAL